MSKQGDLFGTPLVPRAAAPTAGTGTGRYIYCCANRRCAMHDVEVKRDITPYQAADLPTREVRCETCRVPMLWLGPLEAT